MLMQAGQCVEAADTSQYNGVGKPLRELKKTLECLDKKMKTRGKGAGNDYKELRAEYHNRAGRYAFICRDFAKADTHYKQALEYYEKYPNHYIIQLADVKRNMADLCYGEADAINVEAKRNKLKKDGCRLLLQAYMLYRKVADLHGIADVMQSFTNVEDFSCGNADMRKRSSLSFYNMAINLYRQLGDGGACFVAVKVREKFLYFLKALVPFHETLDFMVKLIQKGCFSNST